MLMVLIDSHSVVIEIPYTDIDQIVSDSFSEACNILSELVCEFILNGINGVS